MSNQGDFDQNAAQDAGYAAGRAEGDYNQAGQDVRQDEQAVENVPGDIGRDVSNVPSDIGGMVEGAAKKVGDFIGTGQGDVNRAEGNVQNFDNGVDQSFDQGEQQGRQ